MFSKCFSCFKKLGWKVFGHEIPRWQQHLDNFCRSRRHKFTWCEMFLDNMQLIKGHSAMSKDLEHEIRNTNISSELIKIISKHYSFKENIIRFCVELFGSYIKLKYYEVINPSKATFAKIINDYEEFLNLMIELMAIYYALEDRQIVGEQLFYKSTLPSLIVGFLFDNEEISTTINKTIKSVFKNQIERVQFNFQKYSTLSVDEFNIKDQLKLNDKTLRCFKNEGVCANERPYSGAIQILKEVIRVTNPSDKLHLLEDILKQIQFSISQFYKQNHIKVEKVELDYQNLTNILAYVIVQSNQANLYLHLELINNFIKTINSKQSQLLEKLNNLFGLIERGELNSLKVSKKQIASDEVMSAERYLQGMNSNNYFDEVSTFDL